MTSSFPLVIASAIFAIIALISIVLSISIPSWYVVQTDDLTTSYGSFQICTKDRTTEGAKQECYRTGSQGFVESGGDAASSTTCRHSAGDMSSRFGIPFGLLIVGAIFSIVGIAILLYIVLSTFQRRKKFTAQIARREARRSDPHYQSNTTDDSSSDVEEDESIVTSGMIGEEKTMPLPEIIAIVVLVTVITLVLVAWVVYLQTVDSWLYCDSKPCPFLEASGDITMCEASVSYVFAIAIFAWVASIVSVVLLVVRVVMLSVCPYRSPSFPPDEPGNNQNPQGGRDMQLVDQNGNPLPKTTTPPQQQQQSSNTGATKGKSGGVREESTRAPVAAPLPTQPTVPLNSSGAAVKPGEPEGVDLPEGVWEWDNYARLFWSEEQQYFYDVESAEFYDPESELWYNPEVDEWHSV